MESCWVVDAVSALRRSRLAAEHPELVAAACARGGVLGPLRDYQDYAGDPIAVVTLRGNLAVSWPVCRLLAVVAGWEKPGAGQECVDEREALAEAWQALYHGAPVKAAVALACRRGRCRSGPPPWLAEVLAAYAMLRGVAPRPPFIRGRPRRRLGRPGWWHAAVELARAGIHPAYIALYVHGRADGESYRAAWHAAYMAGLRVGRRFRSSAFPSLAGAVERAARLGLAPREIASLLGVPRKQVYETMNRLRRSGRLPRRRGGRNGRP